MSDWSEQMAKKLKNRSQGKNPQSVGASETEKMKKEHGPKLWEAIKSDALFQIANLNSDMGRDVLATEKGSSQNDFVVVASTDDGVHRSHIQFEPESGRLLYKTDKGREDAFELAIGRDHKLAFHDGMTPYSSGSIAKQILEALLD